MRDLIDLAPPGLDELMTIVEVSDALQSADAGAGSIVVLDTAPSGHALRLLEMPELVHNWVKALMGIVLKYQPVAGIGELGTELLQMSQGLGRLRTLLADPSRAAFIAVTRAAALPVAETVRLVKQLKALDVHVPAVVVNAFGAGTCRDCAIAVREQRRALASIRHSLRRRASRSIVVTPALMPPPHGPSALLEWRSTWALDYSDFSPSRPSRRREVGN
jgi:arsenite-transporting ATPase